MFNKRDRSEEKKAVGNMPTDSSNVKDAVNVISKETKITGDIKVLGNIRIEGSVDGTIHSIGRVVVGEFSVIKGDISTVEAEISGKIEGKVICSEILFLKKTAVISGDITTKKLVVENGAIFNGKCHMNTNALVVSKSDDKNEQRGKQIVAG